MSTHIKPTTNDRGLTAGKKCAGTMASRGDKWAFEPAAEILSGAKDLYLSINVRKKEMRGHDGKLWNTYPRWVGVTVVPTLGLEHITSKKI